MTEVYLHALEQLGAPSRPTPGSWVTIWSGRSPRHSDLGITAIWHDFAGRGLPDGSDIRPDRIIRSLPELLD